METMFEGFKDYIYQKNISTRDNSTLHVDYTIYTYDLVDKDLDYDEEYYFKMMGAFQKMLWDEMKYLIRSKKYTDGVLTRKELVFRGQDASIMESMHVEGANGGKSLKVEVTTFE